MKPKFVLKKGVNPNTVLFDMMGVLVHHISENHSLLVSIVDKLNPEGAETIKSNAKSYGKTSSDEFFADVVSRFGE